jgi:tRNA (mo5U34)-methyltransferase
MKGGAIRTIGVGDDGVVVQTEENPFRNYPTRELLDLARSYNWVHTIDLGHGFTTPGLWGTGNPMIQRAMDAIDFSGRKVLDIGCWDGVYSFTAEQRGAAEVYSTDLITARDFQTQPTFQVAQSLLRSKAKYYPNLTVYEIEDLKVRDFDVVIFTGIYYHLKDPLRALTALRRVMKDAALIIIEGAILEAPGCFANFYYKEQFCGDESNWWVPTRECLRQWVACSFFEIDKEYAPWGLLENQRHCLIAQAVRQLDRLYKWLPEELEEYNRVRR